MDGAEEALVTQAHKADGEVLPGEGDDGAVGHGLPSRVHAEIEPLLLGVGDEAQDGTVRHNDGAQGEVVDPDGGDDQAAAVGREDGTTAAEGVGCGARGRGHNEAVAGIGGHEVVADIEVGAQQGGVDEAVEVHFVEGKGGVAVVGMVGRLSKQKAPDVFLEMAKRVRAQYPNAHFVLVGGGEMIVELQNRIAQNRMQSCVHITEWTTEPLRYADMFDVAVLLSRWEGFGLVLPEYMLLQKPLVATNVDAIPTIVRDGYNGLLVPPDDPGAAAKAVLRLLGDSDLRERLKTQAEQDARERFDVRRVSKSHGQLFEELLKSKG